MKVFINFGHNPKHPTLPDVGAVGFGVTEADIVREIGTKVVKYLTDAGVQVVGTIQDELAPTVNAANNSGADLFVSLHCNAANGKAKGTETFYCGGSSKGIRYAEIMQKQLIKSLNTVDRGIKADWESHVGYLFVLRNTSMPAILIEIAFIDNFEDNQLLVNKQDEIARAIARGITDIELEAEKHGT